MTTQTLTPPEQAAPPRDLWPRDVIERNGASQIHNWSTKRHMARKVLDAAAAALAARTGRTAIRLNSEGQHADIPQSPHYNIDLAHMAITAETVVVLANEVDRLKEEVAELKQAIGKA